MHRITLALILVLTSAAAGGETLAAKARKKAEELTKAQVDGDFGRAADMFHPKYIESQGGRAAYISKQEALRMKIKTASITLLNKRFEEPSDIRQVGTEIFAIVPYEMEAKLKTTKSKFRSFLVAVSADGGKTWQFVYGTLGDAKIREFMPTLPATMKLPEKTKIIKS